MGVATNIAPISAAWRDGPLSPLPRAPEGRATARQDLGPSPLGLFNADTAGGRGDD